MIKNKRGEGIAMVRLALDPLSAGLRQRSKINQESKDNQ